MDICLVGGNAAYNTYSVIAYGQGSTTFIFQALPQVIIDNLFVDASDMDNDGDMDLVLSTYILRNDGTPTAIQTHKSSPNKILIYPNPASTVLNIFSEQKMNAYEVFDLQGRLVQQDKYHNSGNAISILQLPAGSFLLKLLSENSMVTMKQFTIIR